MPVDYVASLLPVLLVIGAFLFKVFSSRAALKHERSAAETLIRTYQGKTADGECFIDGSVAEISAGTESVKYGFFTLEHYSRRFLLTQDGHRYLAVVTKGQAKPFFKRLDPERSELVSEFKEWKHAGVASREKNSTWP